MLAKCTEAEGIPKSLILELELKTENCGQGFFDKWFAKLKSFSVLLMEDIVKFYDKTLHSNQKSISQCQRALKSSVDKQFIENEETIKITKEATKILPHIWKFKKLNIFKHSSQRSNKLNKLKQDNGGCATRDGVHYDDTK